MPKIEIASTTSTAPCSNALSPFIISGIDSFLQDLIDISKREILVGDIAQVASSLMLLSAGRNTRLQQRVSGLVQARLNRMRPVGAVRASGGDRLLCVSEPAVPTQKPQGGSRARQNRAQSGVPYCSIA